MKINKLLTPYNYSNGNEKRIKYIVIHYVGALGGAEANCKYYASQYIGASAHYYVGFKGEIWQSVEDKNIAWHCGAKNYKHPDCRNANSLGIELCVRNKGSLTDTSRDWYFEDETIKMAIELTKDLMQKYNIPADRVIRHYDVTGKICPNPYVYNNTKHTWQDFKSALTSKIVNKSGWYQEDGGWRFYLGDTGNYVSNDWYKDSTDQWAWFNGSGHAISNTWYRHEENWYWFGSDCYMLTNQWIEYKGNQYYLTSDGSMAKSVYIKSKDPNTNRYYYVNDEGVWLPEKNTATPNISYKIIE